MTEEKIKEKNKQLIGRYPFLIPRYYKNDEVPENYDYSYTELDGMPDGWRTAFGDLILEDIKNILEKADYTNKYRIVQIKEKFGSLRWYEASVPNSIADEYYDIIYKYEHISESTCISCGKFPVKMKNIGGWISPYCEECASKIKYDVTDAYEETEEFTPIIKIRKFHKGTEEERELDCSDIVMRMQNKKEG